MEYLEEHNVQYYIRCKGFKALHKAVEEDLAGIDNPEQYTASKPYISEITYSIAGKKERRVVYKAYWVTEEEQMALLPTIYAVVTNDEDMTAEKTIQFYEKRGASENFTKELKNDFNGGTLSHQEFLENEMQFLISSLAYNVYHLYQNEILKEEDRKLTMNTYSLRFQKIAVKVISHARQIILSFSSAYRRQERFMEYWDTVLQL